MRIFLLIIAVALQGCASLTAMLGSSPDSGRNFGQQNLSDTSYSHTDPAYPSVVVRADGRVASVMPPCGNTAVVVNPDGTHSIALINGSTATIVTP